MAKKVNGKKCVEILLAAAAAGFKDYYFFFTPGRNRFHATQGPQTLFG